MSSEGTLAVAAAVVALTQLLKWAGLRDSWAPLAVILLSVVGVLIWLVSGDSWPPARTDIWPILTGVIAVTLSAAGTFGFTRAGASAVTNLTAPPSGGAGSEPSIKSADIPTTYPIYHGANGHEALTALVPANGHETLDAAEARHLNGLDIDPHLPVTCDRCGSPLTSVAAVNGQWVATGETR